MSRTLYDKIWRRAISSTTEEDGTAAALHRPPLGARSHQPAGLRGPAPGRPPCFGAPEQHRVHDADHNTPTTRLGARLASGIDRPDEPKQQVDHAATHNMQRIRRSGLLPVSSTKRAGHRACDRPGAGCHPARHDRGVRRLPHQHARRLRLHWPSASARARSST
jgi:hypothetical protein